MATNQKFKWLSLGISLIVFMGLVTLLSRNSSKAPEMPPKKETKVTQDETQDPFQMVIKGRLAEVQDCYNTLLKRGLKKEGKLVVKWMVDSHGASSQFEEELNEMDSTELFDCTASAIQNWPFPKNRPIQIRYTFKMRAIEKERIIREISSLDEQSMQ